MNVSQLVNRYLVGALTAQHLFVELLLVLDPAHPEQSLEAVPEVLLPEFACFVDDYRPGAMLTTYGDLPTADQVKAAARWLAQAGHRVWA